MFKNYEFKEVEIQLINGEIFEVKTDTITDKGVHVNEGKINEFIPWTSIIRIRRKGKK